MYLEYEVSSWTQALSLPHCVPNIANQSVLDRIEETGDTRRMTTEGVPGTVGVMP